MIYRQKIPKSFDCIFIRLMGSFVFHVKVVMAIKTVALPLCGEFLNMQALCINNYFKVEVWCFEDFRLIAMIIFLHFQYDIFVPFLILENLPCMVSPVYFYKDIFKHPKFYILTL